MGRHSRTAQPAASQHGPGPVSHRGRRRHHPVRTGLLATSAAMAVGAVAASSGLLSDVSRGLGAGGGTGAQADGPDAGARQDGSDAPSTLGGTTTPAGDGTTASPSGTPHSTAPASPSVSAAPTASRTTAQHSASPTRTTASPTRRVVPRPTTPYTAPVTSPPVTSALAAARAQILALVNEQRATAGCHPLTASTSLDRLAQNFSDEMAARDFFSHTDPDGKTPWDRAKALGISNLGGENIARGQSDPQAVMTAWMNSPGHRANILNCDFHTLGVGIHYGPGGPWWTQDFGY